MPPLRIQAWRELERGDDPAHDLILERENIFERPVVVIRPEMAAAAGIHQLSGYPRVVTGLAHAALQYVRHSQIATDVLHVCCFAFVGEGRGASDDQQIREPGESSNKVVGDAIAEIFLVAVAAHVGEGQHGNRGLVGQWESGRLRRRNGCRWSRRSQGEVLHEYDGRGNYREPAD